MEIRLSPRDYGLPHDAWREHQYETLSWAKENDGNLILEAPTGSGKTALPRALARDSRVVSLTRTKHLQVENYQHTYGFLSLFGRANYPCVYEDRKSDEDTAEDCYFAETRMSLCPQYSQCPYVSQRERAKVAQAASLNYAYWLHAYEQWPAVDVLACDEAHQLSDIVLEWAGCTVTNGARVKYDLPMFPVLSNATRPMGAPYQVEERAVDWLLSCRETLARIHKDMSAKSRTSAKARREMRAVERLGQKIAASAEAIMASKDGWYIRSGPRVLDGWGFVARPLSAREHFGRYFSARKLLLMSATIGNVETFATELGLENYDFRRVPSVWAPEVRPVHALDVPRLGHKAPPSAWAKQADRIASAIREVPDDWSGLIHVTSKAEAGRLAERLASRGLQDRVWTPPHAPTDRQLAAWEERKARHPGSLAVSWSMWEGYDGLEERICIAAKCPFPFIGSEFERMRQKYDGKFFYQRAGWQLEQGLGRVRRGSERDYDLNGERQTLVAIADGGWRWVRKYMSQALLESIVEA